MAMEVRLTISGATPSWDKILRTLLEASPATVKSLAGMI